jgi:hypothetical protein
MRRIKHRQPVDGAGNAGAFVLERERTGNNTARAATQRLRRRFEPRLPNRRETKILCVIAAADGIVVEMRNGRPFAYLADDPAILAPALVSRSSSTSNGSSPRRVASRCSPVVGHRSMPSRRTCAAPEDTINRAMRRL